MHTDNTLALSAIAAVIARGIAPAAADASLATAFAAATELGWIATSHWGLYVTDAGDAAYALAVLARVGGRARRLDLARAIELDIEDLGDVFDRLVSAGLVTERRGVLTLRAA